MQIPTNILEVKIGDELFAFNGDKVEQILRVSEITPVPLTDKRIKGVSSISGKIVTIVDIGLLLSTNAIDEKLTNTRILTVNYNGNGYGILVNEVLGMTSVDNDNYEVVEKEDEKIAGFYKKDDDIFQIINESVVISSLTLLSFEPIKLDGSKDENTLNTNDKNQVDNDDRYLFLNLGNETFAITLEMTREIIFVPKHITPIKESGKNVMGIITLRNELITALSLRTLLGFEDTEETEDSRLLIINQNGTSLALLVDSIEEVKIVEKEAIETLPARFSDSKINAIYKSKEGITSLIDKNFLKKLIEEYFIEEEKNTIDEVDNKSNNTMKAGDDDMSEIAVFEIGQEEFAMEIEDLQEIIKYTEITPIPEAPTFVDGVINLRGLVIPIVSLPERLNFEKKITAKSKILVCLIAKERIGLLVDDVNEILFIDDKFVSKSGSEESLFSDVITLNNGKRVILKLRTESILDTKTLKEIKLIQK